MTRFSSLMTISVILISLVCCFSFKRRLQTLLFLSNYNSIIGLLTKAQCTLDRKVVKKGALVYQSYSYVAHRTLGAFPSSALFPLSASFVPVKSGLNCAIKHLSLVARGRKMWHAISSSQRTFICVFKSFSVLDCLVRS